MGRPKQVYCKRGHLRSPDNVYASNGGCITCYNITRSKWREDNPEKAVKWKTENPEKAREVGRRAALKYNYGLTPEDLPKVCEVCGGDNGNKAICVDHDHETGKVRGFLCHGCNIALGGAKDNPARLEKLALYLRERGSKHDD